MCMCAKCPQSHVHKNQKARGKKFIASLYYKLRGKILGKTVPRTNLYK